MARAAAFADACRINALSIDHGGRLGPHRHVVQRRSTSSPGCTSRCSRATTSASPPRATTRPPSTPCWPASGKLDFELLHRLRRLDGLPGPPRHPRRARSCPTNTGSLGHGRLQGQGLRARRAAARRPPPRVRDHRRRRAAGGPVLGVARARPPTRASARSRRSSTTTRSSPTPGSSEVSDLGDLEAKVRAFGWAVARCDGNDIGARCRATLGALLERAGPPEAADRRHGQGRAASRVFEPHDARAVAAPRCTPTTPARRAPELYGDGARPSSPAGSRDGSAATRAARRRRRRAASRPPTPQKLVAAYGEALAGRRPSASRGSSRSTPTSTSTAA